MRFAATRLKKDGKGILEDLSRISYTISKNSIKPTEIIRCA